MTFKKSLPSDIRLTARYLNPIRSFNCIKNNNQIYKIEKEFNNEIKNGLIFTFTFDIELTHLEFHEKNHSLIFKNELINILNLLKKNHLRGTFFVEGKVCEFYRDIVEKILEDEHEIGCHSYAHEIYDKRFFISDNFHMLTSINEKRKYIKKAIDAIKDVTGNKPVSFRSPYLGLDEYLLPILLEEGFLIDSSLYNLEYGQLSFPYHPNSNNMAKNGDMKIYEIPITVSPIAQKKWSIYYNYMPLFNHDVNRIIEIIILLNKIASFYDYPFTILIPIIHNWEVNILTMKKIEYVINFLKKEDTTFLPMEELIKNKNIQKVVTIDV